MPSGWTGRSSARRPRKAAPRGRPRKASNFVPRCGTSAFAMLRRDRLMDRSRRGRPRDRFAVVHQTKIHLLLEAVHLGHRHGHLVAEADDAAGAAADKIVARGVEHEEVILDRR